MVHYKPSQYIILFLFVVLNSCSKNEDKHCKCCDISPPTNIYLTNVLNDLVFNKNSIWIYKQHETGWLDTITVTQSSSGTRDVPNGYPCDPIINRLFYSEIEYSSSRTNTTFSDFMAGSRILRHSGAIAWDLLGNSNDIGPTMQLHTDTTIEGSLFKDIYSSTVTPDTFNHNYFSYKNTFLFCPNVGVVQRIEYDTLQGTKTWNLLQWNVIK